MKIHSGLHFYVYILTDLAKEEFEIGVTGDFRQKIMFLKSETRSDNNESISNCRYVVFWEKFESVVAAINRENELKGFGKKKKQALVKEFNPEWSFLNEEIIQATSWFLL